MLKNEIVDCRSTLKVADSHSHHVRQGSTGSNAVIAIGSTTPFLTWGGLDSKESKDVLLCVLYVLKNAHEGQEQILNFIEFE